MPNMFVSPYSCTAEEERGMPRQCGARGEVKKAHIKKEGFQRIKEKSWGGAVTLHPFS
tara:strand:- start:1234 stop:1407 length:174 start_codon:yes stop_codon:yes gene_type:complete